MFKTKKQSLSLEQNYALSSPQQYGAYATGRLEDSGRQNDEKMWRQTMHSQSYATLFAIAPS